MVQSMFDAFASENTIPSKVEKPQPVAEGLLETKPPGDIVLDPMCGSGTTAVAARKLGRRFIVIDSNIDAIETTYKRLVDPNSKGYAAPSPTTIQIPLNLLAYNPSDFAELSVRLKGLIGVESPSIGHNMSEADKKAAWRAVDWGSANWVILGDVLTVLRLLPDELVHLIYLDPPFMAQRDFRNKDGVGFTDKWDWNPQSEVLLEGIRGSNGVADKEEFELFIHSVDVRKKSKAKHSRALASYLTFMGAVLIECRRILR